MTRFKGLGEMNAEELRDTTLDPANRTLLQVKMDDASGADNLFRTLYGRQGRAAAGVYRETRAGGEEEFGCVILPPWCGT